jgi:putative Ca2+/H+ antiporter (TMEM165/GDT1 family)
MDLKLFATTFVAVFIAELGDKTQLATLSFAASAQSRWTIFLGSALALVATSAIAVVFGEALAKVVSPRVLQRLAGGLFLVVGVWVLYTSFRAGESS